MRPALARSRDLFNEILSRSRIARRTLNGTVTVFLYHEVSDQPSPFNDSKELNVPPAIFRSQLELIADLFEVIGPAELLSGNHATPAALVTFDDGNASYFRTALPIMRENCIPSVCFMNMAPVHGAICWAGLVMYLSHHRREFARNVVGKPFSQISEADVLRHLDRAAIEALSDEVRQFRGPVATPADLDQAANESLVHLGNHLYDHHNAVLLTPDRLRDQFRRNQVLLDEHPRGTRLFSYPFGQPQSCLNGSTNQLLADERAEAVFTAYPLPNPKRQFLWHRVPMTADIRTPELLYRAIFRNYLQRQLHLGPFH